MRSSFILPLLLGVALSVGTALADDQKFEMKPSAVMSEILAEHVGKKVALRLEAGDEIEGTVVQVGKSLVHVSKLSGKEFYDAVISIDKISAVRMKVRDK